MKNTRKILALILSFIICFSAAIPVMAEEDTMSVDEKAQSLFDLTIISGDNGDFNLSGELKRSEAVTLIIKLLGKQEYVLSNKDLYIYTVFPDVSPTDWFAPYVGFSTDEGIVGGNSDGYFYPGKTISERAFLSLMLKVLGYVTGSDYTWDSVYQMAYDVGLVTSEEYKSKTGDNNRYTRADMVNVLYNSLLAKNKDTETTLIQSLINAGVTTQEEAQLIGIVTEAADISEDDEVDETDETDETDVEDDVEAEDEIYIDEIEASEDNKVTIVFTEELETIKASDIKVFETDKPSNELDVDIDSQEGKNLVIETSSQSPLLNYTIEISNCTDKNGNPVDTLEADFAGYRGAELESDFFRISKVEAESKNVLNLYFTQPVNANSEIASYYEILKDGDSFVKGSSKTMTVEMASTDENSVSIVLKDSAFEEDEEYTLEIDGDLHSLYGVSLNDGEGDSIRFMGTDSSGSSSSSSTLKITNVSPLSSKTLRVDFNKYLDSFFAQQYLNYSVTDEDGDTIHVEKALLGGDGEKKGKVVSLTLTDDLDEDEEYSLYINYLTDTTKQYYLSEATFSFDGEYKKPADLSISSVKAIDELTLSVTFKRALNPETAVRTDLYYIEGVTDSGYSCEPVRAYYDGTTVKLILPSTDPLSKRKYKLIVYNEMQDSLGNTSSDDDEYTFTGSSTDYTKPEMDEALIIGKDAIKITFDKEIAEETPNLSVDNYTLQYSEEGSTVSKLPVSVIYVDDTTIVLKFDTLDYETKYTLKFDSLKSFIGEIRTSGEGKNSITVKVGK